MKIRITTGAIPGITKGAIVDATPNGWYTETRPRWFVNGKGIYAYEAEEVTEESDYEDEETQTAQPTRIVPAEIDALMSRAVASDDIADLLWLRVRLGRWASNVDAKIMEHRL